MTGSLFRWRLLALPVLLSFAGCESSPLQATDPAKGLPAARLVVSGEPMAGSPNDPAAPDRVLLLPRGHCPAPDPSVWPIPPLEGNVLTGNFVIRTLADVDSLLARAGTAPFAINGDLTIQGTPLTDLKVLDLLTGVSGQLLIEDNSALTSLEGLRQLIRTGDLLLYGNEQLSDLRGLEQLTYAHGLHFSGNPSLTSLTALSGLRRVPGDVNLDVLSRLRSLDGLDQVTWIGGYLWIRGHRALVSLEALGALTYVGQLIIDDNRALATLHGLERLSSVGDMIRIQRNAALTDLTALTALGCVGGSILVDRYPEALMLSELRRAIVGLEPRWGGLIRTADPVAGRYDLGHLMVKAAVLHLALKTALIDQQIPDYGFLVQDPDHLVVSLEHIDTAWLPRWPEIEFLPLHPDQIQRRADEQGDFMYLRIDEIRLGEERVWVSVSSRWAVAGNSPHAYLSGGGFILECHREGNAWVGQIIEMWIS